MDWVSFEEIKKTVSLQKAIERYGIPLRRVGPNTLRGKCPLPTHSSKESKESFTATLNKGTGGAWACQSQSCIKSRGRVGGNVLDFVAAMEDCSVRDAAIKLQMWFLVSAAGQSHRTERNGTAAKLFTREESKTELVSKEKVEVEESEENKPLTFTLQSIDQSHPYLRERGLTEKAINTFGIGYFSGRGSMRDRIVIPSTIQTEISSPTRDARSTDRNPAINFPRASINHKRLFNLHRVKGELSVVLVEGFFDCMKVTQSGYRSVALMGSTMSKAQEDLLAEHFGHVVVMLDGDEAGRRATEEIEERLRRIVFQVVSVQVPDGSQPDQLADDVIQQLIGEHRHEAK